MHMVVFVGVVSGIFEIFLNEQLFVTFPTFFDDVLRFDAFV